MKNAKSKIFVDSLLPCIYSFAHSYAPCFSWGGPALPSHPNSPKAFLLTVSTARMLLSGLSISSTLRSFFSPLVAVHLALVSLRAFHVLKHFLVVLFTSNLPPSKCSYCPEKHLALRNI